MKLSKNELISVLTVVNPWWKGEAIVDLPTWQRTVFKELWEQTRDFATPRAVCLLGLRQTGKTTLILQTIDALLKKGVPASNILYTPFEHIMLRLAGMEAVLKAWREREPKAPGPEYVFIDDAHTISDFAAWVKQHAEKYKQQRIVFSSAINIGHEAALRLPSLAFYEYLQLKKLLPEVSASLHQASSHGLPVLPAVKSLAELFTWSPAQFVQIAEKARVYVAHFHHYLIQGGFPTTAAMLSIADAQQILRNKLIDTVLKCDITSQFKVRIVQELEKTFLYLCLHDDNVLDMQALCEYLDVKWPTAQHLIEILEAAQLIYRVPPFGYGKTVQRARYKIYLADSGLAPALLLKGKALLEDAHTLSMAAEAAIFKHLFTRYASQGSRLSYVRDTKDAGINLIAEVAKQIIPFSIKYQAHAANAKELKGLQELCRKESTPYAYVITKSLDDFGPLDVDNNGQKIALMRIPAPLLCYWLG